ncbi:MAG: citrate lyase subunit alpha, partial [Acidobacteriota bacterium]
MTKVELKKNAAGRWVPAVVNGRRQVPYRGVDEHVAKGRKAAPPIASAARYPGNGDKRVKTLAEALEACGLSDGMTLSTHH